MKNESIDYQIYKIIKYIGLHYEENIINNLISNCSNINSYLVTVVYNGDTKTKELKHRELNKSLKITKYNNENFDDYLYQLFFKMFLKYEILTYYNCIGTYDERIDNSIIRNKRLSMSLAYFKKHKYLQIKLDDCNDNTYILYIKQKDYEDYNEVFEYLEKTGRKDLCKKLNENNNKLLKKIENLNNAIKEVIKDTNMIINSRKN